MNLKLTPTTGIAIAVVLLSLILSFTATSVAFTTFTFGSDVSTAVGSDDFEFIEGSNVTLEMNTSDKSITISAATTGSAAFELDLGNDGIIESAVLSSIHHHSGER